MRVVDRINQPQKGQSGTIVESKKLTGGTLNVLNSLGTVKKKLLTKGILNITSIFHQYIRRISRRIIENGPEFQHRIGNETSQMQSVGRSPRKIEFNG